MYVNKRYAMDCDIRDREETHTILAAGSVGKLENRFDAAFVAKLASREKQIQQDYRPIIGIHKWFARRPGTLFRNLLLAEFNGENSLENDYWIAHQFEGVIADPFMGGGTPIFEASRLGFAAVGTDINPMAFWIVRQSLGVLDTEAFVAVAGAVIDDVERDLAQLYQTTCRICKGKSQVKYFIWVKTQACPECGTENKLFPGYLLAEAVRHPRHVVACSHCGSLNEFDRQPRTDDPRDCSTCGKAVYVDGPAKRNKITCSSCRHPFSYPTKEPSAPPSHHMWAIEYHCEHCRRSHKGRFFKSPDLDDLELFRKAAERLEQLEHELPLPNDLIPEGDETKRLRRWGYRRYRDMFNDRQLLAVGLLLRRIVNVSDPPVRHALLTVFSDALRYQNMLARYDTYALKCQDIFSVHGFPVGLVQCENNVLGIPGIGAGGFRHFVNKYRRAKEYCQHPFETRQDGRHKVMVPINGERLEVALVNRFPKPGKREAWISCRSAEAVPLPPGSLDGVFTDPPYFDNVQYAELMDFCYVWLRLALRAEFKVFGPPTTRTRGELTGNTTMGKGLDHFTEGISRVFCHYASALKEGAPFVFTFHHNDSRAYIPLVVAILDAGLDCTATLCAPAEMGASLHIARTRSSVLDSIFVCRKVIVGESSAPARAQLQKDVEALRLASLSLTPGDIRCLLAGHIARAAINRLRRQWDPTAPLEQRMSLAGAFLETLADDVDIEHLLDSSPFKCEETKGGRSARVSTL